MKKKTPSRVPPPVESSKVLAKLASKDNVTASENIGKRAAVQWDDGVYEGSLQSYDEIRGLYRTCYDDGDIEWIVIPHKDVTLMTSADGVAVSSKCEHGIQRSSCTRCQREGKKKAKSDSSLSLIKEEKVQVRHSAEAGPSHRRVPNDTTVEGECAICLLGMDDSLACPVTLACSHSFCRPCWSNWMAMTHANASSSSSATCVECPICLHRSVYCPMNE